MARLCEERMLFARRSNPEKIPGLLRRQKTPPRKDVPLVFTQSGFTLLEVLISLSLLGTLLLLSLSTEITINLAAAKQKKYFYAENRLEDRVYTD